MATVAHKTNYLAEAQGRLLEMYKPMPRLGVVLSSFMSEVQDLEDAMYLVYAQRELQSATPPTGDLLAKLGALVGQSSYGLPDAIFLLLIKARIAVKISNGRRSDIINVTQLLFPTPPKVDVFDMAPASQMVIPEAACVVSPYIMAKNFIAPATAAGVMTSFVWQNSDLSLMLKLGSTHAVGFSATPPVTCPDVAAGQVLGSVYHAGFAAGPPPTQGGAGNLAGVINDFGGH